MRTPTSEAAEGQSRDSRLDVVDLALKRARYRGDALIEILHTAQDVFGFLSPEVLWYVARQLRLPASHVYGVATFYHLFSFKPSGAHTCTVCLGTACFVKRAEDILHGLQEAFAVSPGETTEDGLLGVNTARCLGSCGLAPVVLIDGEVVGRTSPQAVLDQVRSVTAAPAKEVEAS